ncbi:uncharacterized protein FMAN_15491 [Fusarium mangiferae]|uniref:Uncharacterized protein n=1 Tax=Fusarium mangiferae TaxID=192010 RepID=A0A1L7UNG5_FUSMA|nr:uncharacterized protein FMAN_15491 [Fusarium mangiferae]CVL09327.1 uncharacterized protein FMAN_15491 [Fusarium mangiferae]
MTTTIKRYCERPELNNQGLFDCLESPLEEIKDRSTLDRRREDKHVIHKTSSKKFKTNPHVAYAYSQMPANESSQFIMPECPSGSGCSARATLPLPSPEASQLLGPEALAAFTKLLNDAAENSRPVIPLGGGVWGSHVHTKKSTAMLARHANLQYFATPVEVAQRTRPMPPVCETAPTTSISPKHPSHREIDIQTLNPASSAKQPLRTSVVRPTDQISLAGSYEPGGKSFPPLSLYSSFIFI